MSKNVFSKCLSNRREISHESENGVSRGIVRNGVYIVSTGSSQPGSMAWRSAQYLLQYSIISGRMKRHRRRSEEMKMRKLWRNVAGGEINLA
jgi:hypothetical protein